MDRNSLEIKADRARRLLSDPVFREAYDGVRNDIISKLEQLQPSNKVLIRELQMELNLLLRMRQRAMAPIVSVDIKENADKRRKATRA